MTDTQRFWSKVTRRGKDQCWIWTGTKGHFGYGVIKIKGKQLYAHRYSYQERYGSIPDKMCVLHRCDTPACVNPGHLFLGTKSQNMADKVGKQRQARGWQVRKVLTASQVSQIRELRETTTLTYDQLAEKV